MSVLWGEDREMKKCLGCGKPIGLLAQYDFIKMAVKPKGEPNRFKCVGYTHDNDKCYRLALAKIKKEEQVWDP